MGWPIDYAHPMHIGNKSVHIYDHFRLNVVVCIFFFLFFISLAVGTCWRKAPEELKQERPVSHSMTKIRIFHGYIRGLNNPNVLSSLLYTLYLYTWWTAQDISIGATHIPIETENVKLPKLVSFIIFCYFLFLLRRAGFFFLVYSFPFHMILFVLF